MGDAVARKDYMIWDGDHDSNVDMYKILPSLDNWESENYMDIS